MATFNSISQGMSAKEVWAIAGPPNELMSENKIGDVTTAMYMWKGEWGANMQIVFQNGLVVSKAQFGLK